MKCSFFQDFSRNTGEIELSEIANDIRSGKYIHQIQEIRLAQSRNDEVLKSQLKSKLPAFTPSGIFDQRRLKENLVTYNQIIHLDFDKISREDLNKSIEKVREIPETFMSFISPSGNGIKVLVRVDSDLSLHDVAYNKVKEFYENTLGIKADKSCKDITRLCFVSFDTDLYFNDKAKVFQFAEGEDIDSIKNQSISNKGEYLEILENLWHSAQEEYRNMPGSRNNLIHFFSCVSNRNGISKDLVIDFCYLNSDLPHREIMSTVNGVYERNDEEFASVKNNSIKEECENGELFENMLRNSPMIPKDLYDQMPEIFRDCSNVFRDFREKDVNFTSNLAILSGCMPEVKGIYDGDVVLTSLFSFVIAPAASGKGVLKYSMKLMNEYHLDVVNQSKRELEEYKNKLIEYKRQKIQEDEFLDNPPEIPKFKVVQIPANTSYAKLLLHLENNGGAGIICETEADSLGNTLKQDWGDFSELLRKSFQHEKMSSSKKTNNEFIEVEFPSLALSLSGTPSQIYKIIDSAENGLFSRFIYYVFKVEPEWKDVSPMVNRVNLTEFFNDQSKRVLELVNFLKQSPTDVIMTKNQWGKLNNTFSSWLKEVSIFTNEEATSIVKRLGLILYRIVMIFTALRKFENSEDTREMTCSDNDFNVAINLVEIYLQHSIIVFNNLPNQKSAVFLNPSNNKRKFYDSLPQEFTRQEAVRIGLKFNMSIRSVDGFLNSAIEKYLEKIKTGYYRKL